MVRLDDIEFNPFQMRKGFDDESIEELMASIKTVGLLNKILVRPHPKKRGRFQLVHGERRLRAFKRLGRKCIPSIIKNLTDIEVAEMSLAENLQRKDLNPIEEAEGYQTLIKMGYTATNIASRFGKSRPYISNRLRLLEMPFFLRACVLCKTLTVWHALTIMGLPRGHEHYRLADLVMDWSLSVKETRAIVNDIVGGRKWISWAREVPLSGLKEDDIFKEIPRREIKTRTAFSIHASNLRDKLEPIVVLVNGVVIDGYNEVDIAKKRGLNTINAVVLFNVDWLARSDSEKVIPSEQKNVSPIKHGIIPKPTERQRRKIRALARMLRLEEASP